MNTVDLGPMSLSPGCRELPLSEEHIFKGRNGEVTTRGPRDDEVGGGQFVLTRSLEKKAKTKVQLGIDTRQSLAN